MKKNSGPRPAANRVTGRNADHHYSSVPRRGKQPAPRESKDPAQTRVDLARRFFCAFCGKSRPESDLVGRDGRLLFCGRCVTALDALYDGADDALTIWKEAP